MLSWLIRLIFWGGAFLLLNELADSIGSVQSSETWLFSFLIFLIYPAWYYGHRFWIRNSLRRKKIFKYILGNTVFVTLLSILFFNTWDLLIFKNDFNIFASFDYHRHLISFFIQAFNNNLNSTSRDLDMQMISILHYATLLILFIGSTFSTVVKDWFNGVVVEDKLEVTHGKLLKTELNPHFFKNILNNIYAQVALQKVEALMSIEKLQSLLEYMLYKTDANRVPLKDEIEFISSLVEIERYRLSEGFDLKFNIKGNTEDNYIAPLILLPFVENAFRHGDLNNKDAYVHISLSISENELEYKVENSIPDQKIKKKLGGIGLKNLEQRLSITYPLFISDFQAKQKGEKYVAKLHLYDLKKDDE